METTGIFKVPNKLFYSIMKRYSFVIHFDVENQYRSIVWSWVCGNGLVIMTLKIICVHICCQCICACLLLCVYVWRLVDVHVYDYTCTWWSSQRTKTHITLFHLVLLCFILHLLPVFSSSSCSCSQSSPHIVSFFCCFHLLFFHRLISSLSLSLSLSPVFAAWAKCMCN